MKFLSPFAIFHSITEQLWNWWCF